jgi:cytochrome b561
MALFNSRFRYGWLAILLHWLMAVLLILLVVLGLYMTRIPISPLKLKLYGWHKQLGILALILVVGRLLWRLINQRPVFPFVMPDWEKFAALSAHWTFYACMFLLPISGWLLTSAAGLPVSFFGWGVLPDFIAPNESQRLWLTQIHNWLAYLLIGLLCLHTLAAFKHHFINKDDILRRML